MQAWVRGWNGLTGDLFLKLLPSLCHSVPVNHPGPFGTRLQFNLRVFSFWKISLYTPMGQRERDGEKGRERESSILSKMVDGNFVNVQHLMIGDFCACLFHFWPSLLPAKRRRRREEKIQLNELRSNKLMTHVLGHLLCSSFSLWFCSSLFLCNLVHSNFLLVGQWISVKKVFQASQSNRMLSITL